jgi:hypothetical protein
MQPFFLTITKIGLIPMANNEASSFCPLAQSGVDMPAAAALLIHHRGIFQGVVEGEFAFAVSVRGTQHDFLLRILLAISKPSER